MVRLEVATEDTSAAVVEAATTQDRGRIRAEDTVKADMAVAAMVATVSRAEMATEVATEAAAEDMEEMEVDTLEVDMVVVDVVEGDIRER